MLNYGSHVTLLKFQMAPKLILLMSSGPKKKEPRYACPNEAEASNSQRMWAEVSSFTPHPLHSGLSSSPIRWRCLLRALCPVRRPVSVLDWVLLKDRNLALAPRQGPEISSGYRQDLTCDSWCNILRTYEGIGTVLLLLVFCRIHYKMYIWYTDFMSTLTLHQDKLYSLLVRFLTLYGLTESMINEWMNDGSKLERWLPWGDLREYQEKRELEM